MGVNGVGNSPIRFTGMASGMDTESIVKQMLSADKAKMQKVDQNRQTIMWKQEAYREIIDDLNSLKSKYFDVLSEDNILSSKAFSGFDVSYSKENVTKVSANAGAVAGDYTVNVKKIAETAKIKGSTLITDGNKSGAVTLDDWNNAEITFNVNGKDTKITLGTTAADINALVSDINNKITANSELNGNITVSVDAGVVKFNTITNRNIKIIDAKKNDNTDLAGLINLKDKLLNPNSDTKLSDLKSSLGGDSSITLDLRVDGVDYSIELNNKDDDKTISDLINAISDKTKGKVTGRISELTGEFTLETTSTGASTSLEIVNSGTTDLRTGLNLNVESTTGKDSEVEITPPGGGTTTVTRSTNKFSIDNVNYELTKVDNSVVTIAPNVDKTFEKVSGFIDKYNELVGKISSKLEEKKTYSYKPLTAEEKEGMEKEEIEKWEKKAKEGILRNDGALEKMLSSLRSAFFGKVEGAGIGFSKSELGLDTSADVGQRGKIIIKDAEKFKEALANKGEQVMRLFTKSSDIGYSRTLSATDRETRYNNSGIFQRLSDIIEDNISTYRDDNGNKGVLLQKAGIKNDTSFINNMLTKQIETKDKLIKELNSKMFDKENRLYQQFAKLEQAMNGMNAQSNWLASQLGGA